MCVCVFSIRVSFICGTFLFISEQCNDTTGYESKCCESNTFHNKCRSIITLTIILNTERYKCFSITNRRGIIRLFVHVVLYEIIGLFDLLRKRETFPEGYLIFLLFLYNVDGLQCDSDVEDVFQKFKRQH